MTIRRNQKLYHCYERHYNFMGGWDVVLAEFLHGCNVYHKLQRPKMHFNKEQSKKLKFGEVFCVLLQSGDLS